MEQIQRKTHIIDAKDEVLGRLATQIVILLRGKHKPDFLPYRDMGDIVIVKNVDKLKFTGRKLEQKQYFSHSPYVGGEKFTSLKILFKKNPSEVLKKAVFGMLPKNRLQIRMIKRLKFEK